VLLEAISSDMKIGDSNVVVACISRGIANRCVSIAINDDPSVTGDRSSTSSASSLGDISNIARCL
jgi:hypothetical protein